MTKLVMAVLAFVLMTFVPPWLHSNDISPPEEISDEYFLKLERTPLPSSREFVKEMSGEFNHLVDHPVSQQQELYERFPDVYRIFPAGNGWGFTYKCSDIDEYIYLQFGRVIPSNVGPVDLPCPSDGDAAWNSLSYKLRFGELEESDVCRLFAGLTADKVCL